MATLKDYIQADIEKTFLNENEFCETHNIDGKPMRVIIDSMELIERDKVSGKNHNEGLYKERTLLYIPISDFGNRPAVGRIIMLDGKKIFTIIDVAEENGIYSITVETHKA